MHAETDVSEVVAGQRDCELIGQLETGNGYQCFKETDLGKMKRTPSTSPSKY
jgi:hypothetical protein